ncbi:MAG TPA: TolC family protein [Allosphingosinicella sp.]|jgi:adhesin transport system outer membrane protein
MRRSFRALGFALSLGAGGAALCQSLPPVAQSSQEQTVNSHTANGQPNTALPPASQTPVGLPTVSQPNVTPPAVTRPAIASEPVRAPIDRRGIVQRPSTGAGMALPDPSADPLAIDMANDPILRLAGSHAAFGEFRDTVQQAVRRNPSTAEYDALRDEAKSVIEEAQERRLPSADLNISTYRVLSRDFSNDPNNIVESSRPQQRTDAILSVSQTLFDFGAGRSRVSAAGARLRAAAAEAEYGADRVALNTVGAWYDVFAYRALVELSEGFIANQEELRDAVAERIRQGASARGDTARVESYLASAQTRLARYRRQLANAEARFTEMTGAPAAAGLQRAPAPDVPAMTKDSAAFAALQTPAARAAQAQADSARQEAKAARADTRPIIAVGLDAGRYGVIENDRDYDVRGRITIRQRLFGGAQPRADQYAARTRSADARATRIREEAARDAAIAWTDVQALEEQVKALTASYIASRRSRDVLIERFVNARGDLFDVVQAEDAYFETAAAYVQALSELDAARYVLLSRTGGLLSALEIDPATIGGQK